MMQAYLLNASGPIPENGTPLIFSKVHKPIPGAGEILLRVLACGVCHTELDEIEGRTAPPTYPIIPGHQVVGVVCRSGDNADRFNNGERVGVAWIYSSCGVCDCCLRGLENLCKKFRATGRDENGGYAEYMVVPQDFAYRIPESFTDSEAAPLLCGGAIGYRSLKLCNMIDGDTLALTGFGASAHIVLQLAVALYPKSRVLVFARSEAQRSFAKNIGAYWAGNIGELPPLVPQSIIDTTPAWSPILESLKILAPGGRLVINAIRKEDRDLFMLQKLDYTRHLWLEKEVKSVANITRDDVSEFLLLADKLKIRPTVTEYSFTSANSALSDLKYTKSTGAKVLVMNR
ncbi:zinc-dependent alcohol dehydrogenase family protein [Desulfosediminicola flagellatus]|uniref:zinc-dependent alcohol dehydrogenase family protein n=1 Tax=Desulfosediminicola flagellatus TaxID=2569541 RepID=UPI00269E972E